jgi:cell division transport system permease protein
MTPSNRRRATRAPVKKKVAPSPKLSGGSTSTAASGVSAWLSHHLHVFFFSLGQISRNPLATLMTASVIGIALALPTGLYLLLENARAVSQGWDGVMQISLYLKPEISDQQAYLLAQRLQQHPDIKQLRVISRSQALQEYKQLSGFSEALNMLVDNPLPAVLVVRPRLATPQQGQMLLQQLSQLKEVDVAQFDQRWLKRLFAIVDIIRRGVLILAVLLALAVLLIIGNTIRLSIQSRREEIEVNKLFGATDRFIRRPFLYSGWWYGFLGSLFAWGLISYALYLLEDPTRQLSSLYFSQYQLITLDFKATLVLLLTGPFLGLLGAGLAVGRHLQSIQP